MKRVKFGSTDLPVLLLGSLVELGYTAYRARILRGRLMGQSNKEIAQGMGIKRGTVANEVSQQRNMLIILADNKCHDCINAPYCEDYGIVPPISALVCDDYRS